LTSYKYGGTSLTTFGKVTLINDNLDIADRRGDNKMIPFRNGKIFSPKYYDERTITFGIVMTAASATALETLFDTLHTLISPRTEQTLEMTLEDASVRNISATVNKRIDVNRITNTQARITIQFDCASPFWRLSTAIADNTVAIDTSPHAMTVTNPGSIEERDPTIIIHGAFTAITITNSTNGASLTYTGAIGTAETVTIGTLNGEYYATLSTGSANVIGNISHSGSACLLPINVGANTLAITSTGKDANSTVKITFNAPYL
jgi:phage-related protein